MSTLINWNTFANNLMGTKPIGAYLSLVIFAGLVLLATHDSCFTAKKTNSDVGKYGWVGMVVAAAGLFTLMVYLGIKSNAIGEVIIRNIFIGCTSGITIMMLIPFFQTHRACFNSETQQKLSWTLILAGLLFQAIMTLALGTALWSRTSVLQGQVASIRSLIPRANTEAINVIIRRMNINMGEKKIRYV